MKYLFPFCVVLAVAAVVFLNLIGRESTVMEKPKVSSREKKPLPSKKLGTESPNIEKPKFTSTALKEYQAFLSATLAELPTIESLRAKKDLDPHLPPAALFETSAKFAEVRERMLPVNGVRDAEQFFDSCAQKNGVLLSLRALCLRNLMDTAQKFDPATTISLDRYSPQIKKLALDLPSLN